MMASITKVITGLFLFLLVCLSQKSFSDNLAEGKKVYRFSENWLRYDKNYESYLPLKNKELKSSKSIHQILTYEKFKNYDLNFIAKKGLAMFVNNKLVYKKISSGEEQVKIPIRNLEQDEKGEVVVTFFHPEGLLPFYSACITYRNVQSIAKETGDNSSTLFQSRSVSNLLSGYAIMFICILNLFVLFKQIYPKEFIRYYSLASQENTDHLLPGSFSIPSLWMTLINGLVLSLLIYMLRLEEILFTSPYPLTKGTLLITLSYFGFYIGKFFYLSLIAWLFNYSRIVSPQFAEYIHFFERVCLFSCLVVFGFVASGFITISIKSEILYYLLIAVLIFCVIKVIFLFFRLITHRNLYLFSYICAAEVLPLIIAVKILLF